MIYSLTGVITEKTPAMLVVECGGVGYLLSVPGSSLAALPAVGETATVYTHLNVTESDVSLFGFATRAERGMFMTLTSVSGVGPKVGLSILSALTPQQIVLAVSGGDHKAFTAASGVGPKLGQRLVLELQDKVAKGIASGGLDLTSATPVSAPAAGAAQQAVAALVALGYTQGEAAKAVAPVDPGLPTAEIVRLALREIGKNR
ncbi:Holliday junction branch migration protein RuvA [Ruminococcaceae bacterium OttesenSCG-928-D13]|nr:Holliday junction branch migration protein RuvA [Ruminococcaceae bacterium OttesenSCG-928-D13]